MNKITVEFVWIPESLGGHGAEPYEGMRTTIRWQRFVEEYLDNAQDAEWSEIDYRKDSLQGKAICKIRAAELTPKNIEPTGELVEFLNGHRVVAVGRVSQS